MPREDQQQHGDADAADVGLDAQRLPEQVADEDAEQVADGQQRGAVDDHGFVSWFAPRDCAIRGTWRLVCSAEACSLETKGTGDPDAIN